jgi:putative membrane protein
VAEYGALPEWKPERPRFRLGGFLVSWLLLTVSLLVAAAIVPNVSIPDFGDALAVALVVGGLTVLLPPLVAALRLPYTLIVDFLLVLVVDALILVAASHLDSAAIHVAGFGWAFLTALVASAVTVLLEAVLGVNRSEVYALRVIQRVA